MMSESNSPSALRLDLNTMQATAVTEAQMPALQELVNIYYAQQSAGIAQPDFSRADIAEAGVH